MGANVTMFGTGGSDDPIGPNSISVVLDSTGVALVELPGRRTAAVFPPSGSLTSSSFGVFTGESFAVAAQLPPTVDPSTMPVKDTVGTAFGAIGTCGYYESGNYSPYKTVWSFKSIDLIISGDGTEPVDAVYVIGNPGQEFYVTWGGYVE